MERTQYDKMMIERYRPDSSLVNRPAHCNINSIHWAPRTNYDQTLQRRFCPQCCGCGHNPVIKEYIGANPCYSKYACGAHNENADSQKCQDCLNYQQGSYFEGGY